MKISYQAVFRWAFIQQVCELERSFVGYAIPGPHILVAFVSKWDRIEDFHRFWKRHDRFGQVRVAWLQAVKHIRIVIRV